MGVKSRTLEIIVISGENIHVTEDAYVVVRGEALKCCSTKMVKDSGNEYSTFLLWNQKFLLDMPMHARSITFEVQSNKFKGVRPIGIARIALSDFLGGSLPLNSLRVLSYRLRDWEGRKNGIIHFAVRVVAPQEYSTPTVEPMTIMIHKKDSNDTTTGIFPGEKNCNEGIKCF
ncbi:hypothetical protein RJT34_15453 [Clitoria ternatea]|uniref:C2 domain-containing protein n=1 Tax=Clitoria ternatea TaxID=43366 RepID=A0AAN9J5G1_CLITE